MSTEFVLYVLDDGFYLFPDTTPLNHDPAHDNTSESTYVLYNVVMIGSLWLWW